MFLLNDVLEPFISWPGTYVIEAKFPKPNIFKLHGGLVITKIRNLLQLSNGILNFSKFFKFLVVVFDRNSGSKPALKRASFEINILKTQEFFFLLFLHFGQIEKRSGVL